MTTASTIVNAMLSGALIGIFYALVASGFSMVWASMKLVNVAHAVLMLVASYSAIYLVNGMGLSWALTFVLVIPFVFVLGGVLYKFVLAHAYRTENFEMVSLVATFGLTIIFENILLYLFGPEVIGVTTAISGTLEFAGLRIGAIRLVSAVFALAATVGLYYLIYRTSMGRSVRAAWQDQEVAMLYGVNPDKVRVTMFAIATGLAGLAGVLLPAIRPISPAVHWDYIVIVFIIVIIGSVGSLVGTLLVGTSLGMIQSTLPLFMPSSWVTVVLYVVLLSFLLYRPEGLFEGWA